MNDLAAPSLHALAAMAVTVAMFVAFARGRLSTEIVSLLTIAVIAVGLYFFPFEGTRPTDGLALAFAGFGHTALITICALMIMGRGLVVTGALDPAARLLEQAFRINGQLGLLIAIVLAMGLSMVVNDTPVVVLLLPILTALAQRGAMATSKTLIPINAAVLIGGMATTIGTSTNLLVVSIASDLGMRELSVFHFTPIVLGAALVALPYLWLVMPRLLRDNTAQQVHAKRRFTAWLRMPADLDLGSRDEEALLARLPADFSFDGRPDGMLQPGQRLQVSGTHDSLDEGIRLLKGQIAPQWVLDRIQRAAASRQQDIQVVEMVVTGDSRLIGRTLATSGIADLYGVAVLGMHKPPRPLAGDRPQEPDTRMEEGDVLLVTGLPDAIAHFAATDSLLQLEGAREMPRRSRALIAAGIMGSSVLLASTGLLPIAIAALCGAILMFATGCVKFDRVGRALSAKVIVLVAASIAVGQIVLLSGAAEWLGGAMALGLQHLPPAMVLATVMLFVTVLTNFASNATAATVGTPIAFSLANQLGMPPEPLVLAVLFGCNLCYATPVAYQTNMLIMAEGNYTFGDYIRTGLPLVAIMVITLSILLVFNYQI
jgi:di/tricarboxylate transporter